MVKEFVVKLLNETSLENQLQDSTQAMTENEKVEDQFEDTIETQDIQEEETTQMRVTLIHEEDEELLLMSHETIEDLIDRTAETDLTDEETRATIEITNEEDIEIHGHNSNEWGFGVLGFWGFGVLGFGRNSSILKLSSLVCSILGRFSFRLW